MLIEVSQTRKTNISCSHLNVETKAMELIEAENKVVVRGAREWGEWRDTGQKNTIFSLEQCNK